MKNCDHFIRRPQAPDRQDNCTNCLHWCPDRHKCQIEKLIKCVISAEADRRAEHSKEEPHDR